MLKTYGIDLRVTLEGHVEIIAESEEEAIAEAKKQAREFGHWGVFMTCTDMEGEVV